MTIGRRRASFDLEAARRRGDGFLPGLVGIRVEEVDEGRVVMTLPLRRELLAPNGFLHAATVIAIADTACGYGCIAHMPEGAENFTTVELKSNFLGTVREGTIRAVATGEHLGRTTQIWDAVVSDEASGRRIALFRCTQMILWPRPAASADR